MATPSEDFLLAEENVEKVDSMSVEDVIPMRVSIWGDEEEEGLKEQVVLSVVWAGGRLGVVYYMSDTAHLYLMHDTAETTDYELLRRVLMEVCPTIILTSSKQEDGLKRMLSAYAQSSVIKEEINQHHHNESSDQYDGGVGVEVLPSTEFKYEVCRRRVLSFPLPGVPAECTEEEKIIKLSSVITMESVNMVRSLGALLRYLEKKRVGVELEDVSTRVPVLAVRRFTLDKLLMMDENAFRSLQIFHTEDHPSVYKNRSGGKEGLSMFGIADHTRSPLGRKLLRLWFTRPLRDLAVLTQRQDAVSLLCSPAHSDMAASLCDCLKQVKNIPRILARMNTSHASMSDWQSLYKTVYNAILIGDICKKLPQTIAVFHRIASTITGDLHRIASLLSKIIDFDESSLQNRFVVKPGVDPELDEKKHTYNGLPELMTRVASSELQNLDDSINECNVIYLPQLGYLLTFTCLNTMRQTGDFTMPNMEFMFLSGNTVHYKTTATKELDHILGDTQCEINDQETAIMHRLQAVVMEHSDLLLAVVECVAELDCLMSLSLLAKEHSYTKPELTSDNVIYIKAGRHPLQELCVTPFVPNDTCCDLDHGRMKILTGPNASGKSVYLKQVGLIVYLAHIGGFVPAEAAKIGLMEGIFTRIQTRESVSLAQSSFLIDLNQVSVAVHNATAQSLVLMDEFGKGTATVDGLSLLVATLHHWLARGDQCPSVFVSTHFHSVIQQKLLPNTQLIEYLMMQSMREGAELVFLYQLTKGSCDSSFACHIASMCGLPASLVERAANVSDLIRRNEPLTITNKMGAETRNKRCAAMVSHFIDLDITNDDVSLFLKDYILPAAEGVF